jgi:murein DD-endopeptidase MepM/ murein hydrolase activator NlpD
MKANPPTRRAHRLSRPDAHRFITVMLVFSHRTYRLSITRKFLAWSLGIAAGVGVLAMAGSAYGLWATQKIMSFDRLQKETEAQARQLRDTLGQAQGLDAEINDLRKQHDELMKLLDPRSPGGQIPALPSRGGEKEAPADPKKVGQLREELERRAESARLIRARMEPILQAWAHTPSIPPTAGYLASGFGIRVNPFTRVGTEGDTLLGFHSGLDITNDEGTPIQATADGEVVSAGWADAYGYAVVVRHNAELETLYAHLSHFFVKAGDRVNRGQILGRMGRSGRVTGVHLHYEVRRGGRPVDPRPYLRLQKEWLARLGQGV